MRYWHAVSLANAGRLQESLPIFNTIFSEDKNWRILTKRLVPLGILSIDEYGLEQILAQK
ncbi:MAG: hypothetical protein GY792_07430 [Gammaproteobacteria bacterium]|nr:hypothetical protein [Gammaproteobacteria bacterium]